MDDAIPAFMPAEFPSTCWSLVARAQGGGTPASKEALADLFQIYWYPVFAYVRRRGDSPQDAQDLTQEFFARLLERDALSGIGPEKGRFRAYLLACCQHFLANERDRARAVKRGRGRPTISIDLDDAERRYRNEPVDRLSPEVLYERRWALTIVELAREELEAEFRAGGKGDLFRPLIGSLMNEPGSVGYAQIGAQLGMTEAAVKKAAQRFRGRFRDLLRQHVADTVSAPEEVDDEVRDLLRALS